jgi:hypothetical protein
MSTPHGKALIKPAAYLTEIVYACSSPVRAGGLGGRMMVMTKADAVSIMAKRKKAVI